MFDHTYHSFDLNDRLRYQDRRLLSKTELADASFDARYSWNPGFQYVVADKADCFFLLSEGGIFTTPHMTLPIGPLDQDRLQTIVDDMAPVFVDKGWPLRVLYVDACYLPLFKHLKGYHVRIAYDRTFSDYLYSADTLRQLPGKDFHAKRNHISRFLREFPTYQFAPLQAADAPEALKLVASWCAEKGVNCQDMLISDYLPIKALLEHFEQLNLRGGVIRIDGQLAAFSIA
ncbi:MAG: phosphatidylglycerol lysyltransferase domain-containing protein, partial [Eubacteriales bacterium]|nr:phosphatidylglycerol lysyltransferase domain-containing protein [Eubacteriales bacterium]